MNESLPRSSLFHPMRSSPTDSHRAGAQALPDERSSSDFDEQFLAHWAGVYRLLLRMVGDPAEAEDLALETFLRLYRRPPAQQEGLNLGGWLHRVAVNLGLHAIRSFKRRERYETAAGKALLESQQENPPAQSFSDPAGITADREDARTARLVLAGMNERQAQLLVLRYSGLAYKEIAQILGVSPASIGPLLFRAEREFEKRYRTHSGDEI